MRTFACFFIIPLWDYYCRNNDYKKSFFITAELLDPSNEINERKRKKHGMIYTGMIFLLFFEVNLYYSMKKISQHEFLSYLDNFHHHYNIIHFRSFYTSKTFHKGKIATICNI